MHPNVVAVYKELFPDEGDLCVSVDNVFFTPTGAAGKAVGSLWPHADVNSHALPQGGWPCFQGESDELVQKGRGFEYTSGDTPLSLTPTYTLFFHSSLSLCLSFFSSPTGFCVAFFSFNNL